MRPQSRPSTERDLENVTRRVESLERRYISRGQFDIKMVDEETEADVATEFIFAMPEDLNGTELRKAECYVSDNGTGPTSIGVENVTQGFVMLSVDPVIDSGDYTSYAGTSGVPVGPPDSLVATGDRIRVYVNSNGVGARGLGVILDFS